MKAPPTSSLRRHIERWATTVLALPRPLRVLVPFVLMFWLWRQSSRSPTGSLGGVVSELLHNGMHVLAYGALAGAWFFALVSQSDLREPLVWRRRALVSIAASTAYGVSDEWHQSFVPGRVSSVGDLLSDATGSTLAVCALLAILCRARLAGRLLPWCVVACLASVAFATWG